MGRIHCLNTPAPGPEQAAGDGAEAVAAIAHGQQVEGVARPRLAPAARDGLGRSLGCEGALELVRDDQDLQCHAGVHGPESAAQSQI